MMYGIRLQAASSAMQMYSYALVSVCMPETFHVWVRTQHEAIDLWQ